MPNLSLLDYTGTPVFEVTHTPQSSQNTVFGYHIFQPRFPLHSLRHLGCLVIKGHYQSWTTLFRYAIVLCINLPCNQPASILTISRPNFWPQNLAVITLYLSCQHWWQIQHLFCFCSQHIHGRAPSSPSGGGPAQSSSHSSPSRLRYLQLPNVVFFNIIKHYWVSLLLIGCLCY